ncbi:alpha-L-glutamate ligase [Fodinicurvata sp. EGI_FJ10296]|uniref:ATP-grasp domain-containing protein n=1 Tax=Fodinicurvata sp. EGI_FJ10296 TaxID=3231908 RepID=UPI0034513E68
MSKIHIIHENDAWTAPLFAALDARGLDYQPWHLAEGRVEANAIPPEGVFYNRMSASSHTRDHRFAPELTRQVLAWLETHGRRVINDSRAVNLEIDKLAQYRALASVGIETPRTIGAVGRASVLAAAKDFPSWPLILKPNRGGAGAGVQLVESPAQLAEILDDPATEWPLDGIWLVQDYIRAAEPCITRCEFIDGRFLYAVRVDTSDGFELCPADACALPTGRERFEIIDGFDDPILRRYERFLAANGIEVAGIEFVRTPDGRAITYDVNTNTNYNAKAEQAVGVSGMGQLADFLGRALDEVRHRKAA